MLTDFRQFVVRGNLIELAVAVVIGTAFAAVVFFLVIRPANALLARAQSESPEDEDSRKCPECLSQIPTEARRCAYCTTQLSAA